MPFELRYHFTCDTKNVLYAITCLGCGHDYIGKTEREVRERCGEYRLAIENKKFTQGVHKHIADCGGKFCMTPFLKIHDGKRDSQTILAYESLFIKRYKPRLNVLKLWLLWASTDICSLWWHLEFLVASFLVSVWLLLIQVDKIATIQSLCHSHLISSTGRTHFICVFFHAFFVSIFFGHFCPNISYFLFIFSLPDKSLMILFWWNILDYSSMSCVFNHHFCWVHLFSKTFLHVIDTFLNFLILTKLLLNTFNQFKSEKAQLFSTTITD